MEDQSRSVDPGYTFFINQPKHREAIAPIAKEAERRGYSTEFTNDLESHAEVGIYLDHVHKINNINSDLSVVMLHSIDDAYKDDHWLSEPWYRFDVGLVHGKVAAKSWREQSWHPKTRPKIGMFTVGWPKFDGLFSEKNHHREDSLRASLDIEDEPTIMYAPYSENDEKLQSFLDVIQDLFEHVLIRHSPRDDVDYSREFYQSILNNNTHVLEDDWEFTDCLRVADILVSDGSSVIHESVLANTIPVVVTEWKRPSAEGTIPDFCHESSLDEFSATLTAIRDNKSKYEARLRDSRARHFAHVGRSAEVVVDLIEALLASKESPVEPVAYRATRRQRFYGTFIGMPYQRWRDRIVFSLSNETKDRLRAIGVDRIIETADAVIARK